MHSFAHHSIVPTCDPAELQILRGSAPGTQLHCRCSTLHVGMEMAIKEQSTIGQLLLRGQPLLSDAKREVLQSSEQSQNVLQATSANRCTCHHPPTQHSSSALRLPVGRMQAQVHSNGRSGQASGVCMAHDMLQEEGAGGVQGMPVLGLDALSHEGHRSGAGFLSFIERQAQPAAPAGQAPKT